MPRLSCRIGWWHGVYANAFGSATAYANEIQLDPADHADVQPVVVEQSAGPA